MISNFYLYVRCPPKARQYISQISQNINFNTPQSARKKHPENGSHDFRAETLSSFTSAQFQFSVVQCLSHVQIFSTSWTAAHQASLSITNSQSLLKSMSIISVRPSNHLSSIDPFSFHLQSFPASGFFQMSQFVPSGSQSIGVSALASVLPMNIQD